MKHIMISIKPQWVAKILNGEKTIEIRKSMPKCELPCKVYIYCTKPKKWYAVGCGLYSSDECLYKFNNKFSLGDSFSYHYDEAIMLNGKVVAEFTLNKVDEFNVYENGTVQYWNCFDLEKSCLTYDEISNYVGKNKIGYAWHIDNLKIYDKPKELSEFSAFIPNNECNDDCQKCNCYDKEHRVCLACFNLIKPLKRPPQSWCYVKGESNESVCNKK